MKALILTSGGPVAARIVVAWPEIDKGDIVGARTVPDDATQGFINWDVRLARAAGDLVVRRRRE